MEEGLTTLYETLGVPKDADPDAIKKAYRKKAQTMHPDKEDGNKEAFQAVASAYAVLSDPERRQQYDETGETKQPDPANDLLEALARLVQATLDEVDVDTQKLPEEMMRRLDKARLDATEHLAKLTLSRKKRESALKRLKRKLGKEGHDLLTMILEGGIAELNNHIAAANKQLAKFNKMQAVLTEYTYTVDATKADIGGVDFGKVDRTAFEELFKGAFRGRNPRF